MILILYFLEVTKPYQRYMISPYKELLSKKKVFEVLHECDYGIEFSLWLYHIAVVLNLVYDFHRL